VEFGCCSIHTGVQGLGQYQGFFWGKVGKRMRAVGGELGAGDWEEKVVAPVRRRPLHQWNEDY